MTVSDRIVSSSVGLVYRLCRGLGADRASHLGGSIMRRVGPRTRNHQRALENLRLVMPHLDDRDRDLVLDGMWENYGRVLGEYPHLDELASDPRHVEIVGLDECRMHLNRGQSGLLLSAHYGNWEITSAFGRRLGLRQMNFHEPLRNPALERLYCGYRRVTASGGLIARSQSSLRDMTRLLGQGNYVGMLIDRRLDDGILAPFLGRPARTNHAPALLARRLGVPIILGRVVRLCGARFRVECQPIICRHSSDWQADVCATTELMNAVIGEWILERPDHWVWFHRRWKDVAPRRAQPPVLVARPPPPTAVIGVGASLPN